MCLYCTSVYSIKLVQECLITIKLLLYVAYELPTSDQQVEEMMVGFLQ